MYVNTRNSEYECTIYTNLVKSTLTTTKMKKNLANIFPMCTPKIHVSFFINNF